MEDSFLPPLTKGESLAPLSQAESVLAFAERMGESTSLEVVKHFEPKQRGINHPNTRAAQQIGMREHAQFKAEIELKAEKNPGWQINEKISYVGSDTYGIPDAMTPSGRPVELKPNTKSGIKKGMAQLKKYEIGAERKGILVLYDPITTKRTYLRTPFKKE